jgi:hypothetical protein
VRVHGSTGEIPAERLAIERVQLQPVPTPYAGRSVRSLQKPVSPPIVGLQHPLSFYDAVPGAAAERDAQPVFHHPDVAGAQAVAQFRQHAEVVVRCGVQSPCILLLQNICRFR